MCQGGCGLTETGEQRETERLLAGSTYRIFSILVTFAKTHPPTLKFVHFRQCESLWQLPHLNTLKLGSERNLFTDNLTHARNAAVRQAI